MDGVRVGGGSVVGVGMAGLGLMSSAAEAVAGAAGWGMSGILRLSAGCMRG